MTWGHSEIWLAQQPLSQPCFSVLHSRMNNNLVPEFTPDFISPVSTISILNLPPGYNIPSAYKAPVYPGGHLHSPVTWSQVAPFWHWHFWWQSFPYVPWSQRSSQRQPLNPEEQWQAPVMGLHKAPFLHWHRLLQWGPQWSGSHAERAEGTIYSTFVNGLW